MNGIAYVRLKPQFKTVVDVVLRQHGFDDVAAVLADKGTPVKELDYLRVVFHTKDDQTLRIPLAALAGADEQTGDYKLAYDEALVWLKAHQEPPPATPPVASSDPDAAARLDEQRRQLDQQRQQWLQEQRRGRQAGRRCRCRPAGRRRHGRPAGRRPAGRRCRRQAGRRRRQEAR